MKRQIWLDVLILLAMWLSLNTLQTIGIANASDNIIELMYAPISNSSDGETFTLKTQLKAKNTGSASISDVIAIVAHIEEMTIDIDKVSFGKINPGETLVSSESFIISYNIFSEQEVSKKEITWQVEYMDINGNLVTEEVLFK